MHIRNIKAARAAFLAVLLIGLLVGVAVFANGPIQEADANILISLDGEQIGDRYGWVGENLGDINGDGVNDFILSAPHYDAPGTTNAGKIYVHSGSDGAVLNAFVGHDFDQLGYSASTAGDVNNDGVPDYIAGGTGSGNAPEFFRGRAVVFSGADHAVLYDLQGPVSSRYGASVAAAGDLNGDNYDDFLVGAPLTNFMGRVYAYSGQDGSLLWSVDGLGGGGFGLGTAAGKVGDINGDGYPEVVVGAAGAPGAGDGSATGGGRAYVYDGTDGSLIYTLKPAGTAGIFGLFFASGAGDVDADGIPDIYVADFADRRGDSPYDPAGYDTGRVYVFSGADGSRIRLINAEDEGEGLGPGRGIGEDVDSDGYGDLVVGGYTNSDAAPNAGKVYIISGKNGQVIRTYTGTLANDWLGAEAFAMGDVNGDGLVDYMLTAYGLSYVGVGLGQAFLVAGTP